MRTMLTLMALLGLAVALDLGGLRTRWFGASRIRSIAVLPLVNLSGDPEQDYFADGVTDELITTLARVEDLNVISRTSSMNYKNTRKSLRQIAAELHVQAVVEGSVRRAGDEVRISAQLVDTRSDRHLWAETYQRGLAEVLAVQNEVALAISDKVRARLSPRLKARLSDPGRVDPAAHEAYLKAQYYLNKYEAEWTRRAIEYFQKAIDLDPTFAAAYAGLSGAYCQASGVWLPADRAMLRARAVAEKALDLDPNQGAAAGYLAYVQGFYDWRWAEAEAGLKRAIALNPSDASAHSNLGYVAVVHRRFAEAAAEFQRAHEIDPLSPLIGFMQLWPLFEERRYAEAAHAAEAMIRDFPDFGLPYLVLGQAHFFGGERERGIRDLQEGYEIVRHPSFLAWEAYGWAAMGRRDRAREIYRRVEQISDTSYVQPYFFALMNAGLGERDSAFSWLQRGVEARSEEMVFLQVDPALDSLRSDPRFDDLLRKVGFKP